MVVTQWMQSLKLHKINFGGKSSPYLQNPKTKNTREMLWCFSNNKNKCLQRRLGNSEIRNITPDLDLTAFLFLIPSSLCLNFPPIIMTSWRFTAFPFRLLSGFEFDSLLWMSSFMRFAWLWSRAVIDWIHTSKKAWPVHERSWTYKFMREC